MMLNKQEPNGSDHSSLGPASQPYKDRIRSDGFFQERHPLIGGIQTGHLAFLMGWEQKGEGGATGWWERLFSALRGGSWHEGALPTHPEASLFKREPGRFKAAA